MSDDEIENDFETEDFGDFDDGGFDDLNDQKGTLGDLWRNNPLVKIGVILAAFAFLVGGIILFGGKNERGPQSHLKMTSDITEAPGGPGESSPAYIDEIETRNTRAAEVAMRNQDSALPMPTSNPVGSLGRQLEEPEEEDPLERWRRMQEERIKQQQVQQKKAAPKTPPPPPVDTRTPAVNALAQAMSKQMESILSNQEINGAQLQNVATLSYLEALEEKERQKMEAALAQIAAQQTSVQTGDPTIILPAGTIEYAQLVIEANTDAPGPVLAQIVTGPLRGGRLIGKFTSTDNYLTLNFNAIVVDGIDYAADAVALDPDTTLPGVVTDIDRRYFKRVILPMAAEFVTGLTEAIADSGKTTIEIRNSDGSSSTTTSGSNSNDQEVASGLAEAGETLADILDEEADKTKAMLRVRAGTPIGVLFVSPVMDSPRNLQVQQQQQQPQQPVFLPQQFLVPQQQNGAPQFQFPGNIGNVIQPASGN